LLSCYYLSALAYNALLCPEAPLKQMFSKRSKHVQELSEKKNTMEKKE